MKQFIERFPELDLSSHGFDTVMRHCTALVNVNWNKEGRWYSVGFFFESTGKCTVTIRDGKWASSSPVLAHALITLDTYMLLPCEHFEMRAVDVITKYLNYVDNKGATPD